MIVVEEKHGQKPKRHSNKYPLQIQIPEVNQPVSRLCGIERSNDREGTDVGGFQSIGDVG
jgi:hypothetical protein